MKRMSTTASVEALGRFYRSLLAGDVADAIAELDPEVELHVPGTHPLAGTHRGPGGVLTFLERSSHVTDRTQAIEVVDLLEGERYAAAYCRVTAERGGRALDNPTIHLARFRHGRIAQIWLHNRDDLAVNDFWS